MQSQSATKQRKYPQLVYRQDIQVQQHQPTKARKKSETRDGNAPTVLANDPAMAIQKARRSPQTLTKPRQVCPALPAKWRKMEESTIQALCALAFAKGSLECNCLDVP